MNDTTFGKVLRDAASLDDIRSNKLAVDFALNFVEDQYSNKYHWGEDQPHSTFECALAFCLGELRGHHE